MIRISMQLLLVALVVSPSIASAHHILGVPHYAYDEDYPQTPVLTYRVDAGRYELRMTGYPGMIEPGDRATFHVYVTHQDGGAPFGGIVTMTVFEDQLLGTDPVVYGPMDAEIDERVFKFHPRFEAEATYLLRMHFEDEGTPWTIDLPMQVGNPGSPWGVVVGVTSSVGLFLIVIRALRIKRRRTATSTAAATAL